MAISNPSPTSLVGASIALPLICVIMVALRFWAHKSQKSKLKLDDWLSLIALIVTIGIGAAIVAGVYMKVLGYPTPRRLNSFQSVTTAKIEYAAQLMQYLQLFCVKLSFIIFFRRVFNSSGVNSKFGIVSAGMIVLITAWSTALFLATLFACRGDPAAWWSDRAMQQCLGLNLEIAFVISDCIIDIMIIVMPLPMIWGLHMTTNRKFKVTAVFALGALAVIASMVRAIIIYEATRSLYDTGTDYDLVITRVLFWSMIECSFALIAACLPPVYGFIGKRILETILQNFRSLTPSRSSHWNSRPANTRLTKSRSNSEDSSGQILANAAKPSGVESDVENFGMGPILQKSHKTFEDENNATPSSA